MNPLFLYQQVFKCLNLPRLFGADVMMTAESLDLYCECHNYEEIPLLHFLSCFLSLFNGSSIVLKRCFFTPFFLKLLILPSTFYLSLTCSALSHYFCSAFLINQEQKVYESMESLSNDSREGVFIYKRCFVAAVVLIVF